MKVGVDARAALSSRPRGEGKALVRLYEEIARLRPSWDVVFYGQAQEGHTAPPGVRHHGFDLPGFRFNSWENIGLPLHARLHGADVLHCAGSSAPRFGAGVPIVMTVHDVIPLLCDDGWSVSQKLKFAARIRRGLRTARSVIAVSQSTKADLMRLFNVPAQTIDVIYWGCDGHGAATSTAERNPPGIDGPYLMTLGGGAPRKNTERVITAFAKAADRIGASKLVIVGAGSAAIRQRFSDMALALGVGPRVRVLEFVDEAELNALYAGTLGLVYASLYEGFGLPALEAMALGLPVIASHGSSIPEVTGDAALLVDPVDEDDIAEAMVKLVCNEPLRRDLAAAGRARAQRFSWRRTAEQTIEVIEGAAEPRRRRGLGRLRWS